MRAKTNLFMTLALVGLLGGCGSSGGIMSPVEGVDYVGFAPEALTFDGTPLNLDSIALLIYEAL